MVLLGDEISTEWGQYKWKARENSYKRNKIKITKHVDCSWYFHKFHACALSPTEAPSIILHPWSITPWSCHCSVCGSFENEIFITDNDSGSIIDSKPWLITRFKFSFFKSASGHKSMRKCNVKWPWKLRNRTKIIRFKNEKECSDSFHAWNSLTPPLQVGCTAQEMHWATDEPHSCCCL